MGDRILYSALAVIFIASCLGSWILLSPRGGGADRVLEVVSDGVLLQSADMASFTEETLVRLSALGGFNVISAGPAGVKMVSADCRGGDCLRMPAISSGGGAIVCLPHRLIVRIRSNAPSPGDEVDSMTY
jgi:hypothetical protein